MYFERFGDRYQLRLEAGGPIRDQLTRLLKAEGIGYAAVSGIGAVSSANVWYWNAQMRDYEKHDIDEQVEIVSLLGTATMKDGAPFLHLHVTLGRRDLSIIGGHLDDAVVNPNLEIWLQREERPVNRVLDEGCGLFVMDLSERP